MPIWPVRSADPDLTARTRGLPGVPARLFLQGELPGGPALAVIGTREPDARGVQVACEVATQAGHAGWVVVSGMSPGVDWVSLEACVAADGRAIAVIPEALPALTGERLELAGRILAAGGCLISAEEGLADRGSRGARLRRDPVITGLSQLVLVVQARKPDGTLAAAAHGLRQGRPVWVVPPGQGLAWRGSRWLRDRREPLVRPWPEKWPLGRRWQPDQPET